VCGVAQSRIEVDTSRATLKDLVDDFLRLELGYGNEFCVTNEIGTLYDVDLDDNLSKPFADLGITNDSFLTVIDEDEDDPRVNLVLSVAAKSVTPMPSVSTFLPLHMFFSAPFTPCHM
jgi:ubiquitin-like 1-activating enzyme E1 B